MALQELCFERRLPKDEGDVEQFNGREGKTATLYERRPLNLNGLGGGFAPRHLNRSASSRILQTSRYF